MKKNERLDKAALKADIQRGHELTRLLIAEAEAEAAAKEIERKAARKAWQRRIAPIWFLIVMASTFWFTFCRGSGRVPGW